RHPAAPSLPLPRPPSPNPPPRQRPHSQRHKNGPRVDDMRQPREEPEEPQRSGNSDGKGHHPCTPQPHLVDDPSPLPTLLAHDRPAHFVMWWHWVTRRTPLT